MQNVITNLAKKKILVAGAGIAGPTVAYWLSYYGMHVTVVERSPHLRTAGQTIDVRGAALEVIKKMGVEEQVRKISTKEAGVRLVNEKSETQAAFDAGVALVADIEIFRGDLANILYERTRENVHYIFGDYITKVEDPDEGEHVKVTLAQGGEKEYDMLIIADGQNSKTRQLVFGDDEATAAVRRLNMYCAFFSIPYEKSDGDRSNIYHAPGGRAMWLRPDGKEETICAHLMTIDATPGYDKLSIPDQKAKITEIFKDAGWQTQRVISAMQSTSNFYLADIIQIHKDKWSKGRVVLLGDAGYCASVVSGMGTWIAVVGAYVLAGEIATHRDKRALYAFEAYEKWFRPVVKGFQTLLPGIPYRLFPQTQWGIWILHTVAYTASQLNKLSVLVQNRFVTAIRNYFANPDRDEDVKLPNYEHLQNK